ncbi:MAG: type Z 30S ribosomal protein S14 [Candidatus Omnitrophica bacterium]|nr:type Z 30S ribosomal protein S14 [Candidatus Omnitrophota bacterium]
MAKKSQVNRWKKAPAFRTRRYSRCYRCGRAGGTYRKFRLCRICLRELAHRGEIPGMTKASW